MLSSGTRAASSACLKCQLRLVLTGLAHRPAPSASINPQGCRQLSSTACSKQEQAVQLDDDEGEQRQRTRGSLIQRHLRLGRHSDGRIIGKPGRRQHQQSEAIRTTSLGKPSEVIVMRDVDEQPRLSSHFKFGKVDAALEDREERTALLSAEDIEAAISRQHKVPEQAEVNASIDELRPESTVLEEKEFKTLTKKLLDGYNMQQLFHYLVYNSKNKSESMSSQTQSQRQILQQVSQWRPGRTPLDQRNGMSSLMKNDPITTKAKLASQILRNAWHMTLQVEEQRIGELEVRLRAWQIALLFDRKSPSGRAALETFLDSPLLMRTTDVKLFRPDKTMRITGRRQDAEEVVGRLERKLSEVGRLDCDLNTFKPLLPDTTTTNEMLTDEDLRQVAERTDSVIERQRKGVLAIYSLREQSQMHARRLLLSMLDLPRPKSVENIRLDLVEHGVDQGRLAKDKSSKMIVSEYPTINVHRRLQHHTLYRLVIPRDKHEDLRNRDSSPARTEAGRDSAKLSKSIRALARRLEKESGAMQSQEQLIAGIHRSENVKTSVEGHANYHQVEPQWSAKFCALLQTNPEKEPPVKPTMTRQRRAYRQATAVGEYSIHSNTVPALAELLSYFQRVEGGSPTSLNELPLGSATPALCAPELVAHLIPSPFTQNGVQSLKELPRVTMTFQLPTSDDTRVPTDVALRLQCIEAIVRERELAAPFPDQAVDLVFGRALLYRQGYSQNRPDTVSQTQLVTWSEDAKRFEAAVQRSYASGTGALDGLPEIKLQLPSWMKTANGSMPQKKSADGMTGPSTKLISVDYMLERFEQVQVLDFIARKDLDDLAVDLDAASVLQQWPPGMVLRCRDVEGGVFAGRRTELILVDMTQSKTPLPLATMAAGLLRLITKANAGLLKPAAAKGEAAAS